MVGRDISTVVLPNADLKIFLTAGKEARAHRRMAQQEAQGIHQDFDEVLKGIQLRDEIDTTRSEAPLVQVPDGVLVNSDNLTLEQTFDLVLNIVNGREGHVAEAH
jgi:cytidylate kinase